jgi:hypothetical protein
MNYAVVFKHNNENIINDKIERMWERKKINIMVLFYENALSQVGKQIEEII